MYVDVYMLDSILLAHMPLYLVDSLSYKTSVYREKKTSLYLLCDDYVLSIAGGTSVSTFLCTRKLGPEVSISPIAD